MNLLANYHEACAITLFILGFAILFLNRNLIKKIIGFNIMDSAIFLFLAAKGYLSGGIAPILVIEAASTTAVRYINPVPTALVLTGIVVSVSVTAFFLALTRRIYLRYGTICIDELSQQLRQAAPPSPTEEEAACR